MKTFNVNFEVSGENLTLEEIQVFLSTFSNSIKNISIVEEVDYESKFKKAWEEYCIKKESETDIEFTSRIKKADDYNRKNIKELREYRSILSLFLLHKSIEEMTEEDWDRFKNPHKYYTKVREIERPSLEVCKKILQDLAFASNNEGPVEHLKSLISEEDWHKESDILIHELESEEFDETFHNVIGYFGHKLNWKNIK
jgi:hypothetical protein